jgi:hypothetical protein
VGYTYRSAFVREHHDGKAVVGGGLNPLPAVTSALNEWAEKGYEPHTIQYEWAEQYFVTTYITFRKEV